MSRIIWAATLGALLPCLALSQTVIGGGVTNGTTYSYGNVSVGTVPGQGYQIGLNAQSTSFGVNLPAGTNWSGATHILLQVRNTGATSAMLFVGFDSGSGSNIGYLWSDTAIPPGQTVTLAMPLQAQTGLGILHWPALADTSLTQVISSGSAVKSNCRRIWIANSDAQGPIALQLLQVSAATLSQNTNAFIDLYGQQTINFPGKVTTDSQLQAQAALDAQLSGNFPFSNDSFGGVAGTSTGLPTGKWTTAKQNGKWFILDPSGNRFFSAGIVGAGWSSYSYTQDRLSFFQNGALPSQSGAYGDHYATYTNPNTGVPTIGYNFYSSNLERKFGTNWVQAGSANIARRMKTWGFNTIAPLTSLSNNPELTTAPGITIGGSYSRISSLDGSSMPDVYDPAWASAAQSTITTQINKLGGSQMNMGVFIDNELPWAWGFTMANYRYLVPFSVLSAPSTQPAKKRLINNLTLLYRTISKLNSVWGTNYSSWTSLQNTRSFNPASVNAAMAKDLNNFTSQFATQYFSTIRTQLTNLNYTGLYLGCRFLYYTPEVLAAAKRYSDVVSFNAYELKPSLYRADMKTLDCPVLISEVGFGASDLGRACGYSPNAATEADRIALYNNYVGDAMTWSNLVGIHWYKWEDDPTSGRMWDNEVASVGLVSITDNPYPLMVAAAQQANTAFHNRLLTP